MRYISPAKVEFLEFLHAQTAKKFVHDKRILSAVMGIISCFAAWKKFFSFHVWSRITFLCLGYLGYALYAFAFSLGEKERCRLFPGVKYTLGIFLFSVMLIPQSVSLRIYHNRMEKMIVMETLVAFGCLQLIPPEENLRKNTTVEDIFKLGFEFIFFKILSVGSTIAWRI